MKLVWISLVALLCLGCATGHPISLENKSRIGSISISRSVLLPSSMYYYGQGSAPVPIFFNDARGLRVEVSSVGGGDDGVWLDHLAREHQIRIDEIVFNALKEAYNGSLEMPPLSADGSGDALMKISVVQYGFSVPNGFSSSLMPVLAVRCEVFDKAGVLIWSVQKGYSLFRGPEDWVSPRQIAEDPLLIRKAWEIAAEDVSRRILSEY